MKLSLQLVVLSGFLYTVSVCSKPRIHHSCTSSLREIMAKPSDYDLDELNEKLRENCCNGFSHEVLKCIESGAVINSRNKVNGWTALHWAAKREHDNIVLMLLKHGANPRIENNNGEFPIDLTSREDIKRLLSLNLSKDSDEIAGNKRSKDETNPQGQSKDGPRPGSTGKMSFVPGYPVLPYAVAAAGNPILTQAVDPSTSTSVDQDPSVLFPGYLAKPFIMAASSKPLSEVSKDGTTMDKEVETSVLVPGYITNPMIPCAVATGSDGSNTIQPAGNESPVNFVPGYLMETNKDDGPNDFKQIFVPHVQQLGSLVNTYVNSMKSLEKPVEYRLYNSCKTTPVATVVVSGPVSELVLKVRIFGEEDFFEVELNSKHLTYEELVNVCCKELSINRAQVNKVRKLPNTIIRRDKDVKRLQPYQELELILN